MATAREAKITELMTLAGVVPRDMDTARTIFADMTDEELDRRLGLMRKGAERMALRREARSAPVQRIFRHPTKRSKR